jgi:hypothetical protein
MSASLVFSTDDGKEGHFVGDPPPLSRVFNPLTHVFNRIVDGLPNSLGVADCALQLLQTVKIVRKSTA